MDLMMGSQLFQDVRIPLLWGKRAILQDKLGRISVIDLSGQSAKLEILGNKPAPGIEFMPITGGVRILRDGEGLYEFLPSRGQLISLRLNLPDCEISESGIRIGTNVFRGNLISGFGVGIAVDETGLSMGGPLPPGLAELRI